MTTVWFWRTSPKEPKSNFFENPTDFIPAWDFLQLYPAPGLGMATKKRAVEIRAARAIRAMGLLSLTLPIEPSLEKWAMAMAIMRATRKTANTAPTAMELESSDVITSCTSAMK